jgi:hypothetical protein
MAGGKGFEVRRRDCYSNPHPRPQMKVRRKHFPQIFDGVILETNGRAAHSGGGMPVPPADRSASISANQKPTTLPQTQPAR